jgi:uncharacterized protein
LLNILSCPILHPLCIPLFDSTFKQAFVFFRYYCSKLCQVSDWISHKEYHSFLEKNRNEHGCLHVQGGEVAKVGSCSRKAKGFNGTTALLRAVTDQNWGEVKNLILGGADPSVADGLGFTALHYAAMYGKTAIVRALLEHGPARLVFCETLEGDTSLIIACAYGHLDVAQILIEAGGEALLKIRKKDGCTCLLAACQKGRLAIVKALIQVGGQALLLETGKDGWTCLHMACQNGHFKIAKALIEAGGEALLHKSNGLGFTCLHTACEYGHLEIVLALVQADPALVGRRVEEGGTCLQLACQFGHLRVVKALIKAGGEALVLSTDGCGCSCLHTACQYGHTEIVKALIKAGGQALLRKTQKDARSCLYAACEHGRLAAARAVVEAGGEELLLATESIYGFSCLHAACCFGHATVVDYLLSLPCAGLVGLLDHGGRTAFDIAIHVGRVGAEKTIRAARARAARRADSPEF